MKTLDKNEITIIGHLNCLHSTYSCGNEVFALTSITVERVHKTKTETDVLPLTIPITTYNDIMCNTLYYTPKVKVFGNIRTYNVYDENHVRHLDLEVFVKDIQICDESFDDLCIVNVEGTIVKSLGLRKTPFGTTIYDFVIANNWNTYKTAYIPALCWNKTANAINTYKVGDRFEFNAILHSRNYIKPNETITHTVYELSINKFVLISRGKKHED